MNYNNLPESDPRYHTGNIKQMLHTVIEHLREDVEKVNDPQAKALFETSAEVLLGLTKAYDHYEQKSEAAWQIGS
jgi:hypothetical protein